MAINLEILDASQSQLTQNEQVKNMIDKGCDVVCVNLVDRTDEGIEAVKNEEMLGTVYNDKEGQAREMLNGQNCSRLYIQSSGLWRRLLYD